MNGRKDPDQLLAKGRRAADRKGQAHAQRHLLLCSDPDVKCTTGKRAARAWKYLKRRLAELDLDGRGGVLRGQTQCLDICHGGPILVVYPDAVWYGLCDPPVIERILQEHLLGGQIVEEYVIAAPLCAAGMIAAQRQSQASAGSLPPR